MHSTAKILCERDTLSGYFSSDRLRCTGAPVVCANVLQWAPSRVTRRGALAATAAAAAAAAFPPLPRHLPPSPLSPRIHTPALSSPSAAHDRLGPAGPLARRHPHHGAPWSRGRQPSPPQNTPSLFRLFPNGATDDTSSRRPPSVYSLSLFFPPLQVRRLCHATTFFLLFRLLARDRDAHASIGIQYRSFRNL